MRQLLRLRMIPWHLLGLRAASTSSMTAIAGAQGRGGCFAICVARWRMTHQMLKGAAKCSLGCKECSGQGFLAASDLNVALLGLL